MWKIIKNLLGIKSPSGMFTDNPVGGLRDLDLFYSLPSTERFRLVAAFGLYTEENVGRFIPYAFFSDCIEQVDKIGVSDSFWDVVKKTARNQSHA